MHQTGIVDLSVAVNVSALQLNDPGHASRVRDVISRMDAPARNLILEITETVLLADPNLARERIAELKECGVQVSLDDFGTGYSSLSALRGFPLDSLKIDRSFVSGVTQAGADRAIVSAIVDLGHALDMYVIAEGAENEAQLLAVRTLGCDRIQGFALSRPIGEAAALELAAAPRTALWAQVDGASSGPLFASGK